VHSELDHYGGSVSLADHCSYVQEFTWRSKNVIVRGSQCKFEENNPLNEKNFALEKYGHSSKCFEHTEKMWEERSCHQTREWQHWGSGCYAYGCNNGRIQIHVANYTFECFHAGQELNVKVLKNNWLHQVGASFINLFIHSFNQLFFQGSIKCPSCSEICDDCKKGEEAPSSYYYPKDQLKCSATTFASSSSSSSITIILGVFVVIFM